MRRRQNASEINKEEQEVVFIMTDMMIKIMTTLFMETKSLPRDIFSNIESEK
jgi:hypothetical protein